MGTRRRSSPYPSDRKAFRWIAVGLSTSTTSARIGTPASFARATHLLRVYASRAAHSATFTVGFVLSTTTDFFIFRALCALRWHLLSVFSRS